MTYLVVGLGNIGPEYADTRHNTGFLVLDALAKAHQVSFSTLRYGSLTEFRLKGRSVYLLKPSTYVNLSGKAVNYWLRQEAIPIECLLIVLDDIALPFGTVRFRWKGSDGGHNGLRSIQEALQTTQYARLRIGIGNNFDKGQQADYVLSPWNEEEEKTLPAIIESAIHTIHTFLLTPPSTAKS